MPIHLKVGFVSSLANYGSLLIFRQEYVALTWIWNTKTSGLPIATQKVRIRFFQADSQHSVDFIHSNKLVIIELNSYNLFIITLYQRLHI
jgi:hypothetical protein